MALWAKRLGIAYIVNGLEMHGKHASEELDYRVPEHCLWSNEAPIAAADLLLKPIRFKTWEPAVIAHEGNYSLQSMCSTLYPVVAPDECMCVWYGWLLKGLVFC